jgi:uncharacterized repeat protein (TIGR01451 family)
LGVGIAALRVALTPEQAAQFQPHIQDAGVYLNCEFPIVANIALSGAPITPPATIEMSASETVIVPGDSIQVTLTVKNSLPNDITNVVVTDLMPQGMMALDISAAAAKSAQIINGSNRQIVVVNLDKMAAGAEETINITVTGRSDVPPDFEVTNTATLFYRESAADQTAVGFTIRGSGLAVESEEATPEATLPAPEMEATATPEIEPTAAITTPTPAASPMPTDESEAGEQFVPPDGLPTTGDDFVPPSFLPITGQDLLPDTLPNTGLGLILPLSGIGLALLAGAAHFLRARHRKD